MSNVVQRIGKFRVELAHEPMAIGQIKSSAFVLDALDNGIGLANSMLAERANRIPRAAHVQKLTKIILTGKWREGVDDSISFNQSGKLVGGQHTLEAFIEAAKVKPDLRIAFWIKFNIPDDEAYAVQANQIAFSGSDMLSANGFPKNMGPALKLFLQRGVSVGSLPAEWMLENAKKYVPIYQVVSSAIGKRRITNSAPMVAALMRALVANPSREKEIVKFASIFGGELPGKPAREVYVYGLSQYFINRYAPRSGMRDVPRAYHQVEYGIQMFLEDSAPFPNVAEKGAKVVEAKDELFPLLEESPDEGEPALLAPIYSSHAWRGDSIDKMFQEAHETGVAVLPKGVQRFYRKSIPIDCPILFTAPGHRKVVMSGIFHGQRVNEEGRVEILVSDMAMENVSFNASKIARLSISQRRMTDTEKLGRQVTPITTGDVAMIRKP